MDGSSQISSPPFNNPSEVGPLGQQSIYSTIRADQSGNTGHNPLSVESYLSPAGSTPAGGDSGNTKRRKVNHGKTHSVQNTAVGRTLANRNMNTACLYCRRSHMTCDSSRPCARCVKRNIGHLCHDEVKDKSRENGSDSTSQSPAVDAVSPEQGHHETEVKTGRLTPRLLSREPVAPTNTNVRPNQSPPPLQPSTNESFDFLNLSWQSYPYLQAPYTFASDFIGNEFSVLNDFMTLGDDLQEPTFDSGLGENMGGVIGSVSNFNNDNTFGQMNPVNGNMLLPGQRQDIMFNAPEQMNTPNPNGTKEAEVAKEHYLLTAADPIGQVSPEERLKQVINAKVDAGILKPFNYVKGYARLQKYMEIQ
jgi:transcription activator of gluconeogenesis